MSLTTPRGETHGGVALTDVELWAVEDLSAA